MNFFAAMKRLVGWPWSSKANDFFMFLFLNVMIFWPALIAARSIKISQQFVTIEHASPWGYTFSLAMFWIPCMAFGLWTLIVIKDRAQNWAFWITAIPLIVLGCLLDILFGRIFFTFESKDSVAAYYFRDHLKFGSVDLSHLFTAPAYHAGKTNWFLGLFDFKNNWEQYLPVEEFLFYTLGFVTLLLLYVWGDAVVFPRHKSDDNQETWRAFRGVKQSFVIQLLVGAVLAWLAFFVQKKVNSHTDAFPGYFLFLLLGALIPSLILLHVSFHFVNWRSLTVAWLFLLTISQFWEGTLAVPYRWWGYQPQQMIGLVVRAQCDLPVEAVLVWSLASWMTVMVYEFVLAVIKLDPPPPGNGAAARAPTRLPRLTWAGVGRKLRIAWRLIRLDEEPSAAGVPMAPATEFLWREQRSPVQALKKVYDREGRSKQSRARISPQEAR